MVAALLTGVVLITLVAAVLWQMWPSVVDRAHYDLLAPGMSPLEIERMLGAPRNECHTDADVWVTRNGKLVSAEVALGNPPVQVFADLGADERELVWIGPDGLIAVRLAAEGLVRETQFSTVHLLERPTVVSWVARWLK
jgi:hypothetical protein